MKAPPRRRRRWGRIAIWIAVWAAGFVVLIATDSFGLNSAWPVLLWSVVCLVMALMAGDRRHDRRPPR
jgi:uncharacterized membrane protein YhhN